MLSAGFGNLMAIIAFLIWGLTPLYYQYMPSVPFDELLSMRLVASVPFMLLVLFFCRKLDGLWARLWLDKRSLFYSGLAGCFMSISWTTFTWAMTHDRVMDASLGYFICPLLLIVTGIVCFHEKLSSLKQLALGCACFGLLYQMITYADVPYVALTMAIFFCAYGWCKKKIQYHWADAFWIETIVLVPFAFFYLVTKEWAVGTDALNSGSVMFWLYIGSAPLTILPLVFYSEALRYTSMTMVGLMQYIEPSVHFLLAVFVFHELFDMTKAITFGCIWLGLSFVVFEQLKLRKQRKADALSVNELDGVV